MSERDIYAEAGHVSVDEARELFHRYHNAATNQPRVGHLMSIPPDPRTDADLRLEAFFRRVAKLESSYAELLADDEGTCETNRNRDPCGDCHGCVVAAERHGDLDA